MHTYFIKPMENVVNFWGSEKNPNTINLAVKVISVRYMFTMLCKIPIEQTSEIKVCVV